MPVYNHARYVGEAVRSVIDQTCPDWQLIAVDDGSTDGSDEIVEKLARNEPRITLIRQANAGPAAARNRALAASTGPWLTYLDSDDLWLPDALESYAAFIDANPQADFIHGFRHRLNPDGSITESPGQFQDAPTGAAQLWERMYLSHLCVCYRRELIDQAGPYDESLRSCEDYELYLRMSLCTRFWPLGKATGLRRRHGSNLSTQTGASRFREAEVLRRFIEKQGGAEVIAPDRVAARLARLYYASGRQYFKERQFAKARAALARSLARGRRGKGRLLFIACSALAPLGRDNGEPLPRLD
jgi:glycosyltransferase involved in cell wall biosynthesis